MHDFCLHNFIIHLVINDTKLVYGIAVCKYLTELIISFFPNKKGTFFTSLGLRENVFKGQYYE